MNVEVVDKILVRFFCELQSYSALIGCTFLRIFRRPFYYRDFAIQFDKLGFSSLFICSLTGLFTGMVMALQALIQLKPFAATSYVGGMVAVTMIKELGPVLASLMVAGRVGSAITAELGTMVVTEQVDAMRVEGTDIPAARGSPAQGHAAGHASLDGDNRRHLAGRRLYHGCRVQYQSDHVHQRDTTVHGFSGLDRRAGQTGLFRLHNRHDRLLCRSEHEGRGGRGW